METLKKHLHRVLEEEFAPNSILLYSIGDGIVGGWVASKSFDGLSDGERLQKLWKLFEKHFNEQGRRRIGTILPLTPLEKKILIDEEENGVLANAPKTAVRRNGTLGKSRRRNGHVRQKSVSQKSN